MTAKSKTLARYTTQTLRLPAMRVVAPPPANAWEPLPGTTPVPLLDLERGMCKWPLSERHMCCGQPADEGKPYCAAHATLSRPRS